jgi:hypothetical protein
MRVRRVAASACAALTVMAAAGAAAVPAGAAVHRGTAAAGVMAAARGMAAAGVMAAARDTGGRFRAACGPARPGYARCFALYAPQVKVDAALAARAAGRAVPASATTPVGVSPATIASAYKLPVSVNPHATVALVDAMSTPHLAADLAVYRKQFGLPPCTTGSGCLRIVNQQGRPSPLPQPDPQGWGLEETLDVAMVSAACPHCKILLVEARSAAFADLGAAENTAVRLGAAAISNSYGGREDGFTQALSKDYRHPGHTLVASSGDEGFTAASFPANLASVTSVGGTALSRASNARGWTERVWNNFAGSSGSGCSAFAARPSWQHVPHCQGRTSADVSAVAWHLALYDSSLPAIFGGPWLTLAGTSASSPLIAGVYALAGNATTVKPGSVYAHPGALFDVTRGNNDWFGNSGGAACGHDDLCVAKPGYDAPTGLGTPDGTGDF